MAQKQFYCPACKKKTSTSERGILLHFRQALSGFDPTWNPPNLHIKWARNNGIKVGAEGYLFNFDKLNDILRQELGKQ
jgi:hypothetical protein